MTKKDALTLAMTALSLPTAPATYRNPNWKEDSPSTIRKDYTREELLETLGRVAVQLIPDKKRQAAANAARKEKTAQARIALIATVAPILREALSKADNGMTAKELYEAAKDSLPADFSAPKVQNILRREMAQELTVTEAKGKANVYALVVSQ